MDGKSNQNQFDNNTIWLGLMYNNSSKQNIWPFGNNYLSNHIWRSRNTLLVLLFESAKCSPFLEFQYLQLRIWVKPICLMLLLCWLSVHRFLSCQQLLSKKNSVRLKYIEEIQQQHCNLVYNVFKFGLKPVILVCM